MRFFACVQNSPEDLPKTFDYIDQQRNSVQRIGLRQPFLKDLVGTTTRWLATGLALVIALDLLNATAIVGAMLGTAGVFGIAIGFAFKDTLENYLYNRLWTLLVLHWFLHENK